MREPPTSRRCIDTIEAEAAAAERARLAGRLEAAIWHLITVGAYTITTPGGSMPPNLVAHDILALLEQ